MSSTTSATSPGLHHVTAIAGDPRRNVAFHTGLLGLRLVKKTVNFDDPGTWHLYYGDGGGNPGTILTFFPWPNAAPGRLGPGETHETSFLVPPGSLGYWRARLEESRVPLSDATRFGTPVLTFADPDGMAFALLESPDVAALPAWTDGDIPAEHAIRGFHGVTLLLEKAEKTSAILTDVFGFKETAREGSIIRLSTDSVEGGIVDIYEAGGFLPGRQGRGSVHHIAFRARTDAEQAEMADALSRELRIGATPQKDRNYFRSVYFREPGGVLFEIATDIPGFAVDEPVESLGEHLKLPAFLEKHRGEIERVLPVLDTEKVTS